jgi:hypothetical protein
MLPWDKFRYGAILFVVPIVAADPRSSLGRKVMTRLLVQLGLSASPW